MKLKHLLTAVAATALMSGAALAQDAAQPVNPTMGSTTAVNPADGSTTTTTTTPSTTMTITTETNVSTGMAASTSVTATDNATGTSMTSSTLTNGPVPDTAENRAKYGQPMSHAGKRTPAKGN